MTIKEIGSFIRTKRKEFGLTQVEVAGLCNVGIRFVSELENGKKTLQIGKVFYVLNSLGFDIVLKERTL